LEMKVGNSMNSRLIKVIGALLALVFCTIVAMVFAIHAISPCGVIPGHSKCGVMRLGPSAIAIRGPISPDTLNSFKETLTSNDTVLHLSSLGGDVVAAFEMAKLIRQYRLNVVVDGMCFSACAVALFPAGISKTVTSKGVVALHWGADTNFDLDFASKTFPISTKRLAESRSVFALVQKLSKSEPPFEIIMRDRQLLTKQVFDLIQVDPTLFQYGEILAVCHSDMKISPEFDTKRRK
jgi:hypothetical protein